MTIRHPAIRAAALVLAVFLAVLGTTSTAFAYWTAGAVGTAEVRTATLGAPTGVRADATGATVTVAWVAPTNKPAGVTTLAYQVVETTSEEVVCSTEAAEATPDCSYTTGAPGAYRFRVTAVLHSWTATSAESDEVAVSGATGNTGTAEIPQSVEVLTTTALEAGVPDRSGDPLPLTEAAEAPATAADAGSASGSGPGRAPVSSEVPGTGTGPVGGTGPGSEGVAVAAGPQITSVSPTTIAPGTTATVTIAGTGLRAISTVDFGDARITTGALSYSDETGDVTVTVTVGAVPPGGYGLTVTDADGATSTRPAALTVD